ncbi:MAG: hypothetical protein WCC06_13115 [Candidatus Aminicenantales bacterium]
MIAGLSPLIQNAYQKGNVGPDRGAVRRGSSPSREGKRSSPKTSLLYESAVLIDEIESGPERILQKRREEITRQLLERIRPEREDRGERSVWKEKAINIDRTKSYYKIRYPLIYLSRSLK